MSCIFSSRIIYLIANNKSSVYIFLNTRVLLHSIITGCHGIWTCNEMVAVGIMQSLLGNEHIHILIAPNLKLLPTILTIKLPKSGNLWRRKLILKLSSLWNVWIQPFIEMQIWGIYQLIQFNANRNNQTEKLIMDKIENWKYQYFFLLDLICFRLLIWNSIQSKLNWSYSYIYSFNSMISYTCIW